jgi:ribonuclease P protein component
MAKRLLRLSRQDFATVANDKTAKRATSAHFSATCSGAAVGCAVVVSKKVAKSSVSRHVVKRRTREAMRVACNDSRAVIVYARAGAAELSYDAIVEEISPLLQRITT